MAMLCNGTGKDHPNLHAPRALSGECERKERIEERKEREREKEK
jgi:hypothetical protein